MGFEICPGIGFQLCHLLAIRCGTTESEPLWVPISRCIRCDDSDFILWGVKEIANRKAPVMVLDMEQAHCRHPITASGIWVVGVLHQHSLVKVSQPLPHRGSPAVGESLNRDSTKAAKTKSQVSETMAGWCGRRISGLDSQANWPLQETSLLEKGKLLFRWTGRREHVCWRTGEMTSRRSGCLYGKERRSSWVEQRSWRWLVHCALQFKKRFASLEPLLRSKRRRGQISRPSFEEQIKRHVILRGRGTWLR